VLIAFRPAAAPTDFMAPVWTSPTVTVLEKETRVLTLIGLQEFDGNWSFWNNKVWEVLGFKRIADMDMDGDEWTTLIVINFLEIRCAKEKSEWELAVKKAKRWLGVVGLDRLEEKAREVVQNN
jgi:hypothetical protein